MNSKHLTQCMIWAMAALLVTAGLSLACFEDDCATEEGGCRMTGGHVAMANVDSTFLDTGSGTKYTTGGQIGAPKDLGCGQATNKNRNAGPWGDWEHNHHSGPDDTGSVSAGSFSFHSGTAAAPDEAFIKGIICADTGWCVQARPAPFKQIFWEGTGVFHNLNANFSACGSSQPKVWNNKTGGGTLHYYRAHVGDFGEPAGTRQKPAGDCQWGDGSGHINNCSVVAANVNGMPYTGSDPEKSTSQCTAHNCSECPDWYEIEIHCGAAADSAIAYKVAHFITEGNFQLHPPVGDSCQSQQ